MVDDNDNDNNNDGRQSMGIPKLTYEPLAQVSKKTSISKIAIYEINPFSNMFIAEMDERRLGMFK